MAYFLEIRHAIGKLPGGPLSDFKWERVELGTVEDRGFLSVSDPAMADARRALLTRPDVIGVRVVFNADALQVLPATFHDKVPVEGGPPAQAPAEGAIVATYGR